MISLEALRDEVPALCRRYGIAFVDVFGSLARDDAGDSSDIDLIIEFEDRDSPPICDRFFGFLSAIEERFGRRIDILTESSIQNPYLRRSIESDRVRIYG